MSSGSYAENVIVLVDDLSPHGKSNPFWCSYSQAPNSGFLLRTDGVIDTAQLWFNSVTMGHAIDRLLSQ